jgi:hypothetical protein
MAEPSWDSTSPVEELSNSQGTDVPKWDDTEDVEKKYGTTSGILKSAGLGAARGVSFGLSDQALSRTGLMTPGEIRAYQEANPVASGVGEVTGVLGAAIAPEAGLLGAVSAPIKAVTKLGSAVTKSALPATESLLASKVLSNAAAHGLGSAVEGAAYGLGKSVSEDALGDPDALGEKLASNIGYSALIGGALGGTFGGAKAAIQNKFPKFLSEVDQKAIEQGDFKAMANDLNISESEKSSYIDGITKLKPNASEIQAAAKELDNAPVLPGMISDNKSVQKVQSSLLESAPTFAGEKARQLAKEGYDKTRAVVDNAIGVDADFTKASLGDHLKEMVSTKVEEQVAPITALYDELKSRYQLIPTSEKSINQIAGNIRNIEDVPLSPQARAIAESAAERVESLKTVDDVKRLRSILNSELGIGATPIQKRVTAIISDKLSNLEESSIVKFAENQMKTDVAKEKILSLLEQREATNAQYTVFRDKIERLAEALGRKRIHGPGDFLDFLEDLTPEKIADKLTNKNNSQFLDWFSKEFPEGMGAISQYQKGLIREAASRGGEFNIKKAISEIEKLPKEFRGKIFTQEELQKIQYAKTYLDAFPKNFNPSGTAGAIKTNSFFESPTKYLTANAADSLKEKYINFATSSSELVDKLSTIERSAAQTTRKLAKGVSNVFAYESASSSARNLIAVNKTDRRDKHDKVQPIISEENANPEKMLENLQKTLSHYTNMLQIRRLEFKKP